MTISAEMLGLMTFLLTAAHIGLHVHMRHVKSELMTAILANDKETREWIDGHFLRRRAV